ncbi:MAG: mechanosensitive ion channel family protein [Alphaproteobacteria bacterium]
MEAEASSGIVAIITYWGIRLLTAAAILIAGWVVGNWTANRVKNIAKLDDTLKSFLGGFAKYAILAIAAVAVLGQLGVQTASLLAVLGAAGLAIGLALQGTLSNVASGVMLLVLRPINVGDYIEAGSVKGTVKALGLFATELATPDNVFVFAPNSQIWSSEIFNYNKNKQRRIDIINGISYGDDIDKAIKTIEKAVAKDKRLITTKGKEPTYFVNNLGDSAVEITARIWVDKSDYWAVKWDLTKSCKEALDKSGITIPFPTQTLDIPSEAAQAIAKAA